MGTIDNPDSSHLKTQRHNDVTWLDVSKPSPEIFAKLEADYQLHPIHLNESVQKVQLTQVEREERYIFLLLHVPVYEQRSDRIQVRQVGIFLGRHFVVTIHDGFCPIVSELFEYCQDHDNKREEFFRHSASYLLYSIVKVLTENLFEISESILNQLDGIEGLVFDDSGSDAFRIGKVRQKIMRLKRVIVPFKSVLDDLTQQINSFSGESISKHYSTNAKSANKLLELIEEAKETIEIYKDADFTTSTEQTNRILAILTLVFTFTIPITVVGTLYGMNVPVPGGIQTGAWTFFGPYTTFMILITLSSSLAIGMFLYFKRKRWF